MVYQMITSTTLNIRQISANTDLTENITYDTVISLCFKLRGLKVVGRFIFSGQIQRCCVFNRTFWASYCMEYGDLANVLLCY